MRNICYLITLLIFLNIGCQQNNEQSNLAKTREATSYPWAFSPIDKTSQMAICQALELRDDDRICQLEQEIMFREVAKKVEDVFPAGKISYTQVETKLAEFPHSTDESRHPDGTLTSIRHAYQLTEYEGACIYFHIDLSDGSTIERISATQFDSGPIPIKCGPSR